MRLLIVLVAGWVPAAQPADFSKSPRAPMIELRGNITKVAVEPRQGPRLLLKADSGEEWTVWLGSLRYLLEHDFNPKAGQKLSLRGIPVDQHQIIAHSICVIDTGQKLELRDAEGRPLWRGQGMRFGAVKPDRPRR